MVDGCKKFLKRVEEKQALDIAEMKNFMEPIFSQAGYREPRSTVDNILILHESAAGDFLSMTPMIREVRRVYPKAHINAKVTIDFCRVVCNTAMFRVCGYSVSRRSGDHPGITEGVYPCQCT